MIIKFLAKTFSIYRGIDGVTQTDVVLTAGMEAEVSTEKGEAMIRDYPNDFEVLSVPEPIAPEPEAQAEEPVKASKAVYKKAKNKRGR